MNGNKAMSIIVRLKRMVAGVLIAIIVALASIFCACSYDQGPIEVSTAVSGRIIDSFTKASLVGAWFSQGESDTIHYPRVYADRVGNYRWNQFGFVRQQVYAGNNGYKTKSRILPTTYGSITGIDFELVRDSL